MPHRPWMLSAAAMSGALAACLIALPAAADPAGAYCGKSASTHERPLPAALQALAAKALDTDVASIQADAYLPLFARTSVGLHGRRQSELRESRHEQASALGHRLLPENPDASVVPMVVTGHDTIYSWSCVHGAPQIQEPSAAVDADGYVADNWREIK